MHPSKRAAPLSVARNSSKQAQALRQAEAQLQAVIELAADFYWEQDEHYRFTVYRPSGEVDAELGGLVGKTSWELSPEPPDRNGWEGHRATLETRQPFRNVVHRVTSPVKGVRYLIFSGQPVIDRRGKFKGYRGIAQDVSEQTRAARLAQLGHVVARGEDLVAAEHDDRGDVVALTEICCRRNDLAVHLARQRVGWRSRQQQRGDARLLIAGVDGDELVHASGVSGP